MIYWKCENKECTEFGKEIIETRPMFKYTDKGTVPIIYLTARYAENRWGIGRNCRKAKVI